MSRNHRAAGQVEMVGTVDLNATDGNAVDRPHVGHAELRAQPGPASYELSCGRCSHHIRASLQHPGGTGFPRAVGH